MPDNKVHIELVADDKANESLKRVTEQLHKMEDARKEATGGGEGGGEGGGGFGLKEAFEIEGVREFADKLKEVVGELIKAGSEQDAVTRSITGTLTETNKTAESYDRLLLKGQLYEEQLHDIAIEAGVTQDKVVGAFNIMVERSGKTAEEASALTKKMAVASAAVPGGIQAMAFGFAQMSSGFVHARNPIVQLIAATGTLKGNALAVTKTLQGMTQEQRSNVAIEAIAKMSEKMEKAKPSLEAVLTSLHTFKEGVVEEVGAPIVKNLIPKLDQLNKSLIAHKDEINDYATRMGSWMSGEFDKVWKSGEKAFHTMRGDGDAIRDALMAAGDGLTDAFSQALEWSADIAKTLSVGFHELTRDLSTTVAHVMDFFKGGDAYKKGTAANFLKGFEAEHGMNEIAMFGSKERFHKEFVAEQERYGGEMKYLGRTEAGWGAYKDPHQILGGGGALVTQMELSRGTMAEQGVQKGAEEFAKAWDKASAIQDKETSDMTKDFAASMLLKDHQFAQAMIGLGEHSSLAWDDVFKQMQHVAGMGGATPEQVEAFKKMFRTSDQPSGSGPIFNIGTMTINQDFRDQDPDRVAIIFQKDLAKAAMNRTQAMLSPTYSP